MNFPLFIFYELLIRLSEIQPEIGDYVSYTPSNNGCIVRTTNGTLNVLNQILTKQFEDPNQITTQELFILLQTFKGNFI